jgi:RecA-family ATPase
MLNQHLNGGGQPSIEENNWRDKIAISKDRKFILYRDLDLTSRKIWLVKNLLGAGEASACYGSPGSGKSVLVADMGLHVAGGLPWHGRDVMQGAVCFLALERRQLVIRRAIAFRKKHGIEDLPFAVMGGDFDFRNQEQAATAIAGIVRQVADETGEKVVLIIIDTISRALISMGGDENSSKDMGAVVGATARLQEKTGAHVQWVHHIPVDGGERLRGHGALLGALDTTLNVEKHASGHRTATVIKANDSEEGERIAFTLESVEIGPETTAPVVVPADAATIPNTKLSRKLPDRAKLASRALTEAILEHGQPAAADLELPPGIKTVTLDQWRDELYRQSILNHEAAPVV